MGSQCLVKWIVEKLNNKIKSAIPEIRKKRGKNFSESKFDKEADEFGMILIKKKELHHITEIVSFIEVIVFSFLTIFLVKHFSEEKEWLGIISGLVKFSAGWLALKVFGNYKQWSGAVLGRAYFYVFFIGSIANIVFTIIISGIIAFFLPF
jgi:hypothetical protein